jgi:hypothetical protein
LGDKKNCVNAADDHLLRMEELRRSRIGIHWMWRVVFSDPRRLQKFPMSVTVEAGSCPSPPPDRGWTHSPGCACRAHPPRGTVGHPGTRHSPCQTLVKIFLRGNECLISSWNAKFSAAARSASLSQGSFGNSSSPVMRPCDNCGTRPKSRLVGHTQIHFQQLTNPNNPNQSPVT